MTQDTTQTAATAATAVDPELLLNLRQQVQAQRRVVEAVREDGLAFYRPHEKQALFHAAGAQYRRRMVRAGNRFGKSLMGCAEDCAWLRGERVWLPKADPLRRAGIPQRPVKGLVITTDWDKVDEIWTSERGDKPGKVWRYLRRGSVKSKRRNHSGAVDMIELVNGSVLRFDTVKSFMANPMGSESSDWDFIHVDEPCPEGMYKAAARGLMDRLGSTWFTLTPLSEPWITDMFFPGDTGGAARDDVWAIDGSIYDNVYLPREAIEEFASLLTEDEKQCRLYGKPLHLAGVIYKAFSWAKHVLQKPPSGWQSWSQPPKEWPIYVGIDPHPQTPHAVLFCAISAQGQRFYFYDIFEQCSIETLCRHIREVTAGHLVPWVKIDPAAYINDPITESNMAEEFIRCGVFVEKATKALAHGIVQVNANLAREPQVVWFAPTARRTLYEIQRYCWDPNGANKPVDRDDHTMECLYRMELSEPRWVEAGDRENQVGELVITKPELTLEDYSLDLD